MSVVSAIGGQNGLPACVGLVNPFQTANGEKFFKKMGILSDSSAISSYVAM